MQMSKDYIVGLVDGEGSFTCYVRNLKDSKEVVRRTRIEPRFYIKLIDIDKEALYSIKEYFQCGNIYIQRDRRKNHQQCHRFEVSNRRDIKEVIIPFFIQNKLRFPSKIKDFKIFCEIMEGIGKGDHLTVPGLSKLYRLKQGMH
jgi:hypothetical protein